MKKFAILSLKNVLLATTAVKRKELPSITEIQRLLLGEKMSIKILLVDNTILTLPLDSYTNVKYLEKKVFSELKILPEHYSIFAVFECFNSNYNSSTTATTLLANTALGAGLGNNQNMTLLSFNERIVDILSRWDEESAQLSTDNYLVINLADGGATGTAGSAASSGPPGAATPATSNSASAAVSNNTNNTNSANTGSTFFSSNSGNPANKLGKHFLLFKVNYYFPLTFPDKDLSAKKLIYSQGIHDVTTGYYPHTLSDALFLAALQLQNKYGDYIIGKEIKELRSLTQLGTILSSSWLSSSSGSGAANIRSEIEAKLLSLYKKLSHVSYDHSMNLTLSYLTSWKLYGAKYFFVKGQINTTNSSSSNGNNSNNLDSFRASNNGSNTQSGAAGGGEMELILAITLHSVILIDSRNFYFLADYHYEQIYSCGHSFDSFVLIVGTKANQVKSYYRTNQGKEIEEILRIYLSHHIRKSKVLVANSTSNSVVNSAANTVERDANM
jgi:hypothetical protein